jgi:hypothetical protein
MKPSSFACAFSLDTGHVLAVGSMVLKVTSVSQSRLNSSLYISGPIGWAEALRSFFLCGTMPGREENALRRQTTTTQLRTLFWLFQSLDEPSALDRWIRELSWPKKHLGDLRTM